MNFSIFLNLITLMALFVTLYLFYVAFTKKDKEDKNIFNSKTKLISLNFEDPDESDNQVNMYKIETKKEFRRGKYDYLF